MLIKNWRQVLIRAGFLRKETNMTYRLPLDWLSPVKMSRIHLHWTAGTHKANSIDLEHYHVVIEGDGNVVRGKFSIADNLNTADGKYAAHTLGANTGAIGVSFASMAGAVESPFNAGKFPLTKAQWERGMEVVSHLASFYKIPVTDKTILSHAEVEKNLGIKQRNKWDITRLPFEPMTVGAKAVGDKMRSQVKALL